MSIKVLEECRFKFLSAYFNINLKSCFTKTRFHDTAPCVFIRLSEGNNICDANIAPANNLKWQVCSNLRSNNRNLLCQNFQTFLRGVLRKAWNWRTPLKRHLLDILVCNGHQNTFNHIQQVRIGRTTSSFIGPCIIFNRVWKKQSREFV
jgi:hypothetical protein